MSNIQPLEIIFAVIFILAGVIYFTRYKQGYGLQGKWTWWRGSYSKLIKPKKASKNQKWFLKHYSFFSLVTIPFVLLIILGNHFDGNLVSVIGAAYLICVLVYWFKYIKND